MDVIARMVSCSRCCLALEGSLSSIHAFAQIDCLSFRLPRTGFTGFHCEYGTTLDVDEMDDKNNDGVADDESHQTVQCAGSVCHNGGTCVTDGDDEHCDCYMAYDDLNKFGGSSCQYSHTTVCGDDNDLTDLKDVPVCFNHGECGANPDDDCICQTR